MKKFLLTVLAISSLIFACNVLLEEIISPFSNYTLRCEGIVLDPTRSYHITEKSSLADLKRIRGNEIDINADDILLHYRDQDMEKVTPSYWGSLFYSEGEWKFLLDKSFSSENSVNTPLPFLRYQKQVNNTSLFVEPNTILAQDNLHKGLLFNYSGGSKASRFYLKLENDGLFPWFDDGVKREISLRDNDTIGIAFNKKFKTLHSKNFSFSNTSHHLGLYQLVYHSEAENVVKIINVENGNILIPKSLEAFQLGNIMFSFKSKLLNSDYVLLLFYLVICLLSLFYFLSRKRLNIYHSWVNGFSIVLVSFLLLGFSTLVDTFSYQSYGFWRKFFLSVFIPAIPFLAANFSRIKEWLIENIKMYIPKLYNSAKKFYYYRSSRLKKIIDAEVDKSYQELESSISNRRDNNSEENSIKFWSLRAFFQCLMLMVFFAVLLAPLSFTFQERVFGYVPVIHYSMLATYALYLIIYSKYFEVLFIKVLLKFSFISVHFFKTFLLFIFSFLIFLISSDAGTPMIIFVSLLLYEGLKSKRLKISKLKINVTFLLFLIPLFSFGLFLLGVFDIEFFRKGYRLTYSFANPANELYFNVNNSDRESFAFIYQGLLTLIDNPFGIDNVFIPNYKRSVSHTDFAIFYSTIKYGAVFIGVLLLGITLLAFHIITIARTLLIKEVEVNKSIYVRSFLAFLLVIFLVNCLVPFCSNLYLPGAFLTGIPFPFTSISLTTGAVVFIILVLLHSIKINEGTEFIKDTDKKGRIYSATLLTILLSWIGIKIFFFSPNEDSYWKLNTSNEYIEAFLKQEPKNNQQILEAKAKVFLDVDSDQLNYKEKEALKYINAYYYNKFNVNKLSKNKGFFYLSKQNFLNEVSLDSLFDFSPKQISGEEWKGKPVFSQPYLVNSKAKSKITSPYWKNIYINLIDLDKDASANINVKLENHLMHKLKAFKNLKAAVVVLDNESGKLVVNSAYPFDFKDAEARINFFPASVKKTLLASYVIEEDLYGDKAEVKKWIKKSSNPLTIKYMRKALADTLAFAKYLKEEFELPLYGGFTEVGWDANEKTAEAIFIGGFKPYTPMEIAGWTRTIANKAFKKDKDFYFEVFNQPLQNGGTAIDVANTLRKNGYNVSNYIAKTGTLGSNTEGINLSSSFIIANEQFSIVVLIGGKQPENVKKLTAKYLYIDLIDELKKYM